VLDMNAGVFLPSWKAQANGWHLVQARTWWQRLALRALALNVIWTTKLMCRNVA
jgi:hypothetical protein